MDKLTVKLQLKFELYKIMLPISHDHALRNHETYYKTRNRGYRQSQEIEDGYMIEDAIELTELAYRKFIGKIEG
jgi:hypothetical protein